MEVFRPITFEDTKPPKGYFFQTSKPTNMNGIYKEPKLKSFGEWMAILIEHREGRITDAQMMTNIMNLQDSYKDLHYACHAVTERFKKAYEKP